MTCPKCKAKFEVLMLLGVMPEFLVCPECKTAYTIDEDNNLKAIATVI